MEEHLGERYVRLVAARDAAGLVALLAGDIDFKALTPSKFWEESTATAVVENVIFGPWFEESDHIDTVEAIDCGRVADRQHVAYRLHVTNADGAFAVEQQAYFDVADGRITWMRVMCAGYQPVTA